MRRRLSEEVDTGDQPILYWDRSHVGSIMHVIAKPQLTAFWILHADSAGALQAWYALARAAEWDSPHAIKAQFPTVSIVNAERVVFNICRNRYRLVCRINYSSRTVFIRFIGTHREYDQIDAATI